MRQITITTAFRNTLRIIRQRDMQDHFHLSPGILLRTQTSAGQIHVMEAKAAIKIVSPNNRIFPMMMQHIPRCLHRWKVLW